MAENISIDDDLMKEALRIGGLETKNATVNEALREFVRRRKQKKILELFGKIDYDKVYNPKDARRR